MTKSIPLTQGRFAIVDDDDYDNLNQYKWCYNNGYAVRLNYDTLQKKQAGLTLMHRVILNAPNNRQVDHINHDKLDNRKSNLRIVTHAQNQQNRLAKKNGTSKYKGVSWSKSANKWGVIFMKKWVGGFDKEEDAAKAYDEKAKEAWGEFAKTNF